MFKIFKKTMMISELIELYQQGRLNLSPYYQRTGEIWKTAKKQNLIDISEQQTSYHRHKDD